MTEKVLSLLDNEAEERAFLGMTFKIFVNPTACHLCLLRTAEKCIYPTCLSITWLFTPISKIITRIEVYLNIDNCKMLSRFGFWKILFEFFSFQHSLIDSFGFCFVCSSPTYLFEEICEVLFCTSS